jgi:hypothetical protein
VTKQYAYYTTFENSQGTRAHTTFVNNQVIRLANAFANVEGTRGGTRVAIVSFVNLFKVMKLFLTSNNQTLMLSISLILLQHLHLTTLKLNKNTTFFFLLSSL